MRHFVHHQLETGLGLGQVGLHVVPAQHQRAQVPGLAGQFVHPFGDHAGVLVVVAAMHAEGAGVHQHLAPAMQALGTELEQGQAGQAGKLQALAFVERQPLQGRDGFFVEEARHQPMQAFAARGYEACKEGQGNGEIAALRIRKGRRRGGGPEPAKQGFHGPGPGLRARRRVGKRRRVSGSCRAAGSSSAASGVRKPGCCAGAPATWRRAWPKVRWPPIRPASRRARRSWRRRRCSTRQARVRRPGPWRLRRRG